MLWFGRYVCAISQIYRSWEIHKAECKKAKHPPRYNNNDIILACIAALQNYYKDNANLAEEIAKHVMDNREEQVKETIKRKIDK